MIRRSLGLKIIVLALLVLGASTGLAQSVLTSALRGHVEVEGAGLPGVLVTIKSPVLQGERTTSTSANGDYAFSGIPPGDYTVTFTLQGFQTVTRKVSLAATQPSSVDATMAVAGVTASTTVSAKSETVSTTTQASTTVTSEMTNKLPIARTIVSEVGLSSGVAQITSLGNAFTISGGMTFDNLFTVDCAVVMDNVRGTPNNLFIEDAIQETTTSVNSVSSEYGRFTGGVVNTVTKSGGNSFAGSFRTTLTNDQWQARSPANETKVQLLNPRYEATLGGPFWKDHIWFFGSGRMEDTTDTRTTSFTAISYPHEIDEKRYQGKLTITPIASQTVTGNYLKVDTKENGNSFGVIMDSLSLVNRSLPQEILTINYNGVITNNFFLEGLYSKRKFTFENSGSLYTDVINGTLMRDRSRVSGGASARYNSPTFCGICDPEHRDNRDYLIKGTYFLSTPSLGSHNIVLGYDNFSGTRKANNYQSGSNYRVFTTSAILTPAGCGTAGNPCSDIFPVINSSSYVYYTPIDTLSQGTDTLTHSAFLNDSWRLSDRLTFNLGVRYDKNDAKDSRDIVTVNDSQWSPRIAAAYDVTGNGALKVGASYATYVAAIQDNLVDSASNAGVNSTFIWYIEGAGAPVINSPAGATLTTRADALNQVFNWFFAQGCPNIATCKLPLDYALVAGLSTQIPEGGLKSPHANEYTFGVNGSTGNLSYRADFVRREFKDFFYTNLNLSTGQAADITGKKYDVGIQGNTNDLFRDYTALQTQFQYRMKRLNFGANWTWSHTIGNVDGEAGNTGPVASTFRTYPEYKQDAWFTPKGDLATDVRHRVRMFATWDMPFFPENLGALSLSGVQAFDTGAPYGAVGTVRSRDYVTNPGYATRPSSVTYYYTARDAFRTDDIKRTDLALNFSTKIASLVELFIQPQIINLFNNHGKVTVINTVRTFASAAGGNYANFNPFTTTPKQGISAPAGQPATSNWDYARAGTCTTADPSAPGCALTFGTAANNLSYQQPRTFQITMGLRF